jgi:hypothetical protein
MTESLKIPPLSPKYMIVHGVKGVPKFFWVLESFYFCLLRAHSKFQNPMTISEFTPLSPEICYRLGGVGGLRILLLLESFYF